MSMQSAGPSSGRPRWQHVLLREDVLSGLMFVGIAAIALWVSRDYPIGTALRMGTGYVPRLLCWIMLILGVIIAFNGLRAADSEFPETPTRWLPLIFVPASLAVFGYTIQEFGLVIATFAMIGVGSLAGREIRPLEILISAAVLTFCTWAIFVWALDINIPIWPGG